MLIRNAHLQMASGEKVQTDLRMMHGCVQEIGANLEKGLYEAEIDLQGDELRPPRLVENITHVESLSELQRLCRSFYRQGAGYFCTDAPETLLRAIRGAMHKKMAVPLGVGEAESVQQGAYISVGTVAPLNRFDRSGVWLGVLDAHSGD